MLIKNKSRYIFFIIGVCFLFICQFIKWWVLKNEQLLKFNDYFFWNWKTSSDYQIFILVIVISIGIILFLGLLFYFSYNFWIILTSASILFPGLSNLLDRLLNDGSVIDYIRIDAFTNSLWFNLEDIILFLLIIVLSFKIIIEIVKIFRN